MAESFAWVSPCGNARAVRVSGERSIARINARDAVKRAWNGRRNETPTKHQSLRAKDWDFAGRQVTSVRAYEVLSSLRPLHDASPVATHHRVDWPNLLTCALARAGHRTSSGSRLALRVHGTITISPLYRAHSTHRNTTRPIGPSAPRAFACKCGQNSFASTEVRPRPAPRPIVYTDQKSLSGGIA